MNKLYATACLSLLGLLPYSSQAAVLYFDPNGSSAVTAGTYTWDTTSLEWATSTALTASPVAWNSADAACFTAGTFNGAITVDVNSAINLPGFFNGALTPPGVTVTLAGTGSLNWEAGTDGLDTSGSDSAPTTINVTMSGPGQVETEGSKSLFLNGNNNYTGGTIFGGSGGVNFSTSTAFGTGTITWGAATMVLASQGTSPLTIANNVQTTSAETLVYAGGASAPTTFSGAWALPASGLTATLQVNSGTPMTISGLMSGAGNFKKTGAGNLVLSGANTYTGTTTITAGTVSLGVANAIAHSSQIVLSGGTLNLGGFSHSMAGTLSLTAASSIDFTATGSQASFADSHSVAWTSGATLDLLNWNSSDSLQFGNSSSALTAAQLGDFEINGVAEPVSLDANGFLVVPEPGTVALSLVGGLGLLLFRKRKSA